MAMVSSLLLRLLGALLILKLAWNLCVPYSMISRSRRGDKGGVSMFTPLELLLLGLMIVCAAVAAEDGLGPGRVAWVGLAAIVLSYVHMYAVAFADALWTKLRTRRR